MMKALSKVSFSIRFHSLRYIQLHRKTISQETSRTSVFDARLMSRTYNKVGAEVVIDKSTHNLK